MTNNLEATDAIFDKDDYDIMPILGVARTVKRELRKLHTTFGGFGLFLFANRAANLQNQHAASTLPHIHGS